MSRAATGSTATIRAAVRAEQVLDGVAAQTARTDHDGRPAGPDAVQRSLHGVVAGGPGIGEGPGHGRVERGQLHQLTGAVTPACSGPVRRPCRSPGRRSSPRQLLSSPRTHQLQWPHERGEMTATGSPSAKPGDPVAQRRHPTADLVAERERHLPADGLAHGARHLGHADVGVAQAVARHLDQRPGPARARAPGASVSSGGVLPLDDPVGLHRFPHVGESGTAVRVGCRPPPQGMMWSSGSQGRART